MKLQSVYFSDLTEQAWLFLKGLVVRKRHGRPPKWSYRVIMNAIFYVCKTGCQWRLLPHDFPPWGTVYWKFHQWLADGTWEGINRRLLAEVRRQAQRDAAPSVVIIDSQSAKTTAFADSRGFDGGKKVKGRKRHILVDILGMLVDVAITDANRHDSKAAPELLSKLHKPFRLHVCFADSAYVGQPLRDWSFQACGITIKVTKRSEDSSHIATPKRWIVERSFAWLLTFRRLSIDYERHAATAETWVRIAMAIVGLSRLEASA